jgi:hypothetical protein
MSAANRRGFLSGLGVVAVGGLLAACGSEESAPPAVPTGPELDGPTPAVTTDQMSTYLKDIHSSLKKADEAKDADELKPRIVGSAASFRKATYEIIEKDEDWAEDSLDRPSAKALVPITSTTTDFPRTALALVEAEDSKNAAPYFMVLQQADAKKPYTTWGWAQQVAGVDMPTVPSAEVGSDAVGAETDDLLMKPADAFELYASVLAWGNGKDKKDQLADDPFKSNTHEQIQQERKELNTGVEKDEVGTIREIYTPVDDEIAGLRTEDGGAIVLGTLTSERTVKIKDGAKVSYAEDNIYTRIIGTRTFTSEYVREYGTTVALYIPPKGSDAKIQPIGATRTVVGAHGE